MGVIVKKTLDRVYNFCRRDDGPTSVEYAVIVGLIFLALITAVQLVGGITRTSLQESSDQIDTAFNAQGQN